MQQGCGLADKRGSETTSGLSLLETMINESLAKERTSELVSGLLKIKPAKASKRQKRKIRLLYSIKEVSEPVCIESDSEDDSDVEQPVDLIPEEHEHVMEDKKVLSIVKKLHKHLRWHAISRKSRFFESPDRLDDVVADINAIRNGNYILVDEFCPYSLL